MMQHCGLRPFCQPKPVPDLTSLNNRGCDSGQGLGGRPTHRTGRGLGSLNDLSLETLAGL